jgi:Crp-like helix-turn-helix domain
MHAPSCVAFCRLYKNAVIGVLVVGTLAGEAYQRPPRYCALLREQSRGTAQCHECQRNPPRRAAQIRPGLHGTAAHSAIANARARIDQRLARWLLTAHDRIGDNTLPLTHEFLALMLGVRRAGVTESLQSLKRQKLIYTGRNEITVLNRKGIERVAGNSYGVPEKEYRRLIG